VRKPTLKAVEGDGRGLEAPGAAEREVDEKKKVGPGFTPPSDPVEAKASPPRAQQQGDGGDGTKELKEMQEVVEGEGAKGVATNELANAFAVPPPVPPRPTPVKRSSAVARPAVAPPPTSGVISSSDSSSDSSSADSSSSDDEEDKPAKKEKVEKPKGKRGGSRVSVSLKEMTDVVQMVANYNFYAAPHKGVKQMQLLCVQSLKDKGYAWSIARIRRFIDGVIQDYRAQLKGKKTLPTGNPYDWLQGVQDAVSKINTAITAKEQKRRAKELKKERKEEATKQNEERREKAKEELLAYGSPDDAAAQLGVKPRSKKMLKREVMMEEVGGSGAEVKGETPEDSSAGRKRARGRVDIVARDQETKRIEAETRQMEMKMKLEKVSVEASKVAIEEKKLEMQREEAKQRMEIERKRLEIEERKEAAQSQVALQTAQALSSVVAVLAALKK